MLMVELLLDFFVKLFDMPQLAFKMKLFKGYEEEYKKRHDEIWPELVDLLHEKGISEYSIFLDEESGDLFGVLNIIEEDKMNELPVQAIMQRWWLHMKDIMETQDDYSPVSIPLKKVFYMK